MQGLLKYRLIIVWGLALLSFWGILERGSTMNASPHEVTTFAGGCFWCMEAPFDHLEGVQDTIVGYMGGQTPNPTYKDISTSQTGHAEVIQVHYDPDKVSYKALLKVFWRNIDPTTMSQQFADRGNQYRTAIFYHNDLQQKLALASKQDLEASGKFKDPIVTEISPASTFYRAEESHQDYYLKNPFHYKNYSHGSGRVPYLKKIWGESS